MYLSRLLPFVLLATSAFAQDALTDMRQVQVSAIQVQGGVRQHFGYLQSLANEGSGNAQLEWLYGAPGTPVENLISMVIPMPMNRVGSMELLPSGELLVVGHAIVPGSTDVGVIALVHLDAANGIFYVVDAQSVGSANLTDVRYDAAGQRIFMIDAAGRSVLAANYSGSGALPTTHETVVDSSGFSSLQRPLFSELRCETGTSGIRVYETNGTAYTRFDKSGGAWIADSIEWTSKLSGPEIKGASRFLAKNRPWTIETFGDANFPIDLQLLAEGGVDAAVQLTGPVTTFAAPASLNAPGDSGSMHSVATGSFDFRTCLRFGEPQNAGFFPFGELYCDVFSPYIGQDDMVVSADVLTFAGGGTQLASALTGECRIGIAPAGGPYPVTELGSAAVLTQLLSIPFSVDAGSLPTNLSFRMPEVPAGTDQTELLFQIVVSDGSEVAFTEVFGIDVRPHDVYNPPPASNGIRVEFEGPSQEELSASFERDWSPKSKASSRKQQQAAKRISRKMLSFAKSKARR